MNYRSIAAAAALYCSFALSMAQAATFSVVHTFPANEIINGGLVMDNKGNMWGTTFKGGVNGVGYVFEITSKGAYSVVHAFGAGTDGRNPTGRLMMDKQHNLWGVTPYGGTKGKGTIFQISPTGAYSVAYNFCSVRNQASECMDGDTPWGGLMLDNKKVIWGTTAFSGGGQNCSQQCGTVFKFVPGTGLTTVHAFTNDGIDIWGPYSVLLQDKKKNIWGTTYNGGIAGRPNLGGIFKIDAKGVYSVFHKFCGGVCGVPDGGGTMAGLIQDKAGTLWSTTAYGGGTQGKNQGSGTIYTVSLDGEFSVVKTFDLTGQQCGSTFCNVFNDGFQPRSELVLDKQGNKWGTTNSGGPFNGTASGSGVVFQITPAGSYSVVHTFYCSGTSCPEGANPPTGLTLGKAGSVWGVTSPSFAQQPGPATVFKITP